MRLCHAGRPVNILWQSIFVLLACALIYVSPLHAAEKRHGLSAFGDLKYPADFTHFDYVNPDAPKGGRISMIGTAGRITFDSFNNFIIKGDAAQGLEYYFDTLMVRAWDEADAVYGLVAHSAELADDRNSVTFYLRKEAAFADGTPVRAADVVFSFNTLKKDGHPRISLSLRDVVKAEAVDPLTVRYSFKGNQTRDLPLSVAVLPVFSKAYYAEHDFTKTTLKPPMNSGPYEIAKFRQGQFVTYRRRADYWGWHLPVNRGRFNFDEMKYEYFKDRVAELEALKSGEYDLREEFTSRDWAVAYDIEPVRDGRLIKRERPDDRPSGTQGFFLNLRRDKFADIHVRQALDFVFDFEWTRKNLFHNAYQRTVSYFENSNMKAVGPPSAAERALLEPYRDQLPASIFEAPHMPAVSDGSGRDRRNLKKALDLFRAGGWAVRDGVMRNASNETFNIEFLTFSPSFERIIAPYVKSLGRLGVKATIRLVDPAQYERRLKTFDFDIVTQRYSLRLTPGAELRNFWGSEAANLSGSFNLSGISSKAVDGLIEKVLQARSRPEMLVATRALDRVLRAGSYWVPHWYNKAHRMVYWNKFSQPAIKPRYDRGVIETWWYDSDKAARLNAQ